MPRIRSAQKRVEVTERNRQRNMAFKSMMRTAIKKVLNAVQNKTETPAIQSALNEAYSIIDRGVLKGIVKKNTAARYKSRVARHATQAGEAQSA